MSDAEVPPDDALDQARPVDPDAAGDRLPHELPADAAEADAFEQSREIPVDDDWD